MNMFSSDAGGGVFRYFQYYPRKTGPGKDRGYCAVDGREINLEQYPVLTRFSDLQYI